MLSVVVFGGLMRGFGRYFSNFYVDSGVISVILVVISIIYGSQS